MDNLIEINLRVSQSLDKTFYKIITHIVSDCTDIFYFWCCILYLFFLMYYILCIKIHKNVSCIMILICFIPCPTLLIHYRSSVKVSVFKLKMDEIV